jgi:hypothetical protein
MNVRKLTRRQLAGALAGAVPVLAQASEENPPELLKQALKEQQENIQALDRVNLPMSAEPASIFRAL